MTKTELKQLLKGLAAVEKTKIKLGEVRDTLREQIQDLEDIYDSMNEGHNLMDDGLNVFKDGLDNLSQFV